MGDVGVNAKVLYNTLLSIRGLIDGLLIQLQEDEPKEPAKGQDPDGVLRKVQDATIRTFGKRAYAVPQSDEVKINSSTPRE